MCVYFQMKCVVFVVPCLFTFVSIYLSQLGVQAEVSKYP